MPLTVPAPTQHVSSHELSLGVCNRHCYNNHTRHKRTIRFVPTIPSSKKIQQNKQTPPKDIVTQIISPFTTHRNAPANAALWPQKKSPVATVFAVRSNARKMRSQIRAPMRLPPPPRAPGPRPRAPARPIRARAPAAAAAVRSVSRRHLHVQRGPV